MLHYEAIKIDQECRVLMIYTIIFFCFVFFPRFKNSKLFKIIGISTSRLKIVLEVAAPRQTVTWKTWIKITSPTKQTSRVAALRHWIQPQQKGCACFFSAIRHPAMHVLNNKIRFKMASNCRQGDITTLDSTTKSVVAVASHFVA